MLNLCFFASGNGSNMQAIINSCKNGILKDKAIPKVVISNNSNSKSLDIARNENIKYSHISNKSTHNINIEILNQLVLNKIDLIILAGYMKKIEGYTLVLFKNRILNIHPSLLPKYGGKNMYGERVHNAVYNSNDNETGATVHIVNENYDKGRILKQKSIKIDRLFDNPKTIQKRVLEIEHKIYIETINDIIDGKIDLYSEELKENV